MSTPPKLDLKKIVQVKFPESQYYKEDQTKKQIIIHHTVSGPDSTKVFEGWVSNPEKVATAFVISADGVITQGFGSQYRAHHSGLKKPDDTNVSYREDKSDIHPQPELIAMLKSL